MPGTKITWLLILLQFLSQHNSLFLHWFVVDQRQKVYYTATNTQSMTRALGKHRPPPKQLIISIWKIGGFVASRRWFRLLSKFNRIYLESRPIIWFFHEVPTSSMCLIIQVNRQTDKQSWSKTLLIIRNIHLELIWTSYIYRTASLKVRVSL